MLLPLKTTYQPNISPEEFDEAYRLLLSASAFSVSFYSDPTRHRPQSELHFMSCFSSGDNSRCQVSKEKTYFSKGLVMLQKPNKKKNKDKGGAVFNLHLVVEVYAMNTFLLSRTCLPLRDIVEIRTGLDAYHLQHLRKADSSKMATLFSSQTCIELAFGSARQRNEFVKYCRKVSTYCREGGG